MPLPKKGQSQKEYVSRAVPIIHDEGTAITTKDPKKKYKQAVAIAHSMYKSSKKKKKKKMRKIEEVLTFDNFKKVNEGLSKSFIERSIKFMEKFMYLFKNVQLSDEQMQNFINAPNLKQAIANDKEYISQIKRVLDRNENIIEPAYEEEFGVKEEFLFSILLSLALMVFIIYAQRRGWIDQLLRKIDPKIDSRGGCGPGGCGPVPGDEWKYKTAKKKSWKERFGLAPPKAKVLPKPSVKQGDNRVNAILDKMGKVGYDNLSQDEKDYLKRMQKNENVSNKYCTCNVCGLYENESRFRGYFDRSLKCPECKSTNID
jgi:hypothetical protein